MLDFDRWPAWLDFVEPMLAAFMVARDRLTTAMRALSWRSVMRDGRTHLCIACWSVGGRAARRASAYADLVRGDL